MKRYTERVDMAAYERNEGMIGKLVYLNDDPDPFPVVGEVKDLYGPYQVIVEWPEQKQLKLKMSRVYIADLSVWPVGPATLSVTTMAS